MNVLTEAFFKAVVFVLVELLFLALAFVLGYCSVLAIFSLPAMSLLFMAMAMAAVLVAILFYPRYAIRRLRDGEWPLGK